MKNRVLRENKSLFVIIMLILSFSFQLLQFTTVEPSKLEYGPQSADNDITQLDYLIDYYYKTGESVYDESLNLNLLINGTDRIYENGTIRYYLPNENITDSTLLEKLELIFTEEQVNFFANHQSNDYYETYFMQRNETANPTPISNFNDDAQYLVFWLNSSEDGVTFLRPYRIIRYFDVSDSVNLAIQNENPLLTESTWEYEKSDLRRPVRTISTYLLGLESNGLSIKLFYDQKFAILLRAQIEYVGENEEFELNIRLSETSLDLDFQAENPYWVQFRNGLIIGSIIGITVIGIIITSIFLIKNITKNSEKKPKKKSILDQI